MKKFFFVFLVICMSVGLLVSCSDDEKIEPEEPPTGNNGNNNEGGDNEDDLVPLKDLFKDLFTIGAAVGNSSFLETNTENWRLLTTHFGSVTAENCMKPDAIHPKKGVPNWDEADKLVSFAERNRIKVRGHVLAWHAQTADWMWKDNQGKYLSKEQVLENLRDHIHSVVGRYKGRIYAWDVVNEVCADWPPESYWRTPEDSDWVAVFGEDISWIEAAFHYAHEADPDAKLFYNDYGELSEIKSQKIYYLIKTLKERGAPIHGLGMQGHWSVGTTEQEIRNALDLYSQLGVDIQITELDVSVYGGGDSQIPYSTVYTKEMEAAQIEAYTRMFKVFYDYKDVITGVTFWGVADNHTWLDNSQGRAFPFLFDDNYQPKAVYAAVQKLINELQKK